MIISFSGSEGSGKSTIAQKLAEKLNWPRYYVGALRREAAKKRGMTLAEYNKLGEIDPETDTEVDKYQEKLGKQQKNFIIEGRTSWYFIPHSFKIYLGVDKEVGAKRIFSHLQQKNDRNEGNNLNNWQDVLASNEKRSQSDRLRYQKYYGIDVNDLRHYDYYLDTTNFNQDEVFSQVWQVVEEKIKAEKS